MKVTVMQPYFIPYAGYIRLLACADIFVVYDCVQFPRRSWVHRNKLRMIDGTLTWFTLPIKKACFDEKIKNIAFREDAKTLFLNESKSFPAISVIQDKYPTLYESLITFDQSISNYNVTILRCLASLFDFKTKIVLSSDFNVPEIFKGQERVLKLVEKLEGDHYINAPGGLALYDPDLFVKNGIKFNFLSEYIGDYASILQLLAEKDVQVVRSDIIQQCANLS